MAVLDKIFFWRKKEEPFPAERPPLGLPGEEELGLKPMPEELEEPSAAGLAPPAHAPPRPMPAYEPPETPAFSPAMPPGYAPQQMMPPPITKDLELISAKLDALKASLDNLNQRLANLERIARGEHETY
jgi:hypothetical protein